MAHLRALDNCRGPSIRVPEQLRGGTSPLRWKAWEDCLRDYPDHSFTEYIVQGIRDGFRIGFNYRDNRCRSAKQNMYSAREHPQVVREYLAKECSMGHVLGPFSPETLPQVQVSRFGVIPKSTPNKWRLILDLSSPEGASVNNGIEADLCSLSYVSVDDAAQVVAKLGEGALLAKIDIRSAYRMVPVHPDDRLLLGMIWEQALYVDSVLPFRLRSAPKVFTAVADAVEWTVRHQGVENIYHYLDDFFLIGAPGTDQCARGLRILLAIFEQLSIPVAWEKLEGPAKSLTILGIEVDSEAMVLRLPKEKLGELKLLVTEWLGRKSCSVKELQSLAGKLQHACKVVRPGRTFLRRVFDLLKGTPKKRQFVRLNAAFRSDIWWWHRFLESWNGVSMLPGAEAREEFDLFSDASGSFGCGAWWDSDWLQYAWPTSMAGKSIALKELVPIVMACLIWGSRWRGRALVFHCDNQAVVEVVNAGVGKDPELMQLMRCLFFVRAHFVITARATHIPGRLSRRHLQE